MKVNKYVIIIWILLIFIFLLLIDNIHISKEVIKIESEVRCCENR